MALQVLVDVLVEGLDPQCGDAAQPGNDQIVEMPEVLVVLAQIAKQRVDAGVLWSGRLLCVG